MTFTVNHCSVVSAVLLAIAVPGRAADTAVSFEKEIKPILEGRCLECHGEAVKLSDLDLRTRESALAGGKNGPVFVGGNPDESLIYRRITGLDQPSMPLNGELSDSEIAVIRRWIEGGASWDSALGEKPARGIPMPARKIPEPEISEEQRNFWAFRSPSRRAVPVSSDPVWNRHPVDAFLRKTMDDRGLTPAPAASRRALVRRAYLDLIGLPPTPQQVAEFLEDNSPAAWENLIEQLLASPHYGERWGRHWLDVARYADSNGYEHDFNRPNAWRYRDYVIRSFNRDTPYSVFLREQIAGDEIDWVTNDSLIATGFLRSHAKVGYREKDNPQYRYDYLDDMIATVGRGILGLTPQCARCHDHKFDPISQLDYYKLQASLWGYVEVDHPLTSPEKAAAHEAKNEEINERLRPYREQIRELEAPYREKILQEKYSQYPRNVRVAIATPEEDRTPGQVLLANQVIRTTGVSAKQIDAALQPDELALKRQWRAEMKRIEKDRPEPIPVAMGITDGDYRLVPDGPGDAPAPGKGPAREKVEGVFLSDGSQPYQPPPSYFLYVGDVNSRGPVMSPGFPRIANEWNAPVELPPAHRRTSGRRLALADWLVSPEHPLTARVFINRIWHHHFGRGIVATLDNFGKAGDRPTHTELLDWLAVEFRDRGWSIKQMHRLLMTSRTYRMSSQFFHPDDLKIDPENLYLWRFRPQRLEAEIVRDAILAVSGSLNNQIGGPAVFPPLPQDILKTMKHGIWEKREDGPEVWRRSVYVYRKRGLPFPFFEVFDLPDQNITCGRRNVSTVPTQALTLLNNEFVLTQARLFADRVAESAGDDTAAQLELAYRLALNRPPTETERALGVDFLRENSLAGLTHVLLNLNEFVYLR